MDHWRHDVFDESRDVTLFLGNLHRFQDQWMILGVFWPPLEVKDGPRQLGLEL